MAKEIKRDDIIEFELYNGKIKGKFFEKSHQYWVNGKRKTGVTTFISSKDKSKGLVSWAVDLMRDYLIDILDNGGKICEDDIAVGSGLHNERKTEAANIGTEVHNWIEDYIKGKKPDMPKTKEVQNGVNAFLDWVDSNKVKFISAERVVYSKKHDYIGKMDIEAKVNKKHCLIDIKTSNDLRNDYLMQTAAYVKADEEESGVEYDGRWLLRVTKETEKEYYKRLETKNELRLRFGKNPIDIPEYQVFEALFLDSHEESMDEDFKAFLSAKNLYQWNLKTDFFINGKDRYGSGK